MSPTNAPTARPRFSIVAAKREFLAGSPKLPNGIPPESDELEERLVALV